MRLVDTSAWLEWMMDTAIGEKVHPHLPDRSEWLVPTIVQLELAKWLRREVGEGAVTDVTAFTQFCVVAPLTTEIALAAAHLCGQHGLSIADGVIYATARAFAADLLTCDAHFRELPDVVFLPKVPLAHA